MFLSESIHTIINNRAFEIVLEKVEIILHPFFRLGLDLFERIKFNFVFPAVYIIHFHIVLISKFLKPEAVPRIVKITDHRHLICVVFDPGCEDNIRTTETLIFCETVNWDTKLMIDKVLVPCTIVLQQI